MTDKPTGGGQAKSGGKDGPLHDVLAKLEDVTNETGEQVSKFLEDAEIKRRHHDAVDAFDGVVHHSTARVVTGLRVQALAGGSQRSARSRRFVSMVR